MFCEEILPPWQTLHYITTWMDDLRWNIHICPNPTMKFLDFHIKTRMSKVTRGERNDLNTGQLMIHLF